MARIFSRLRKKSLLIQNNSSINDLPLELNKLEAYPQINGSQLAKMKKSIPDISLPYIYRDEAAGLKSCKCT